MGTCDRKKKDFDNYEIKHLVGQNLTNRFLKLRSPLIVSVVCPRAKAHSRGGSGAATISSTGWTITGLSLFEGSNVITVTARDASNNTATTTLTVTYSLDVTDTATSSGLDLGVLAIILVLLIAIVGAVVFLLLRRKK